TTASSAPRSGCKYILASRSSTSSCSGRTAVRRRPGLRRAFFHARCDGCSGRVFMRLKSIAFAAFVALPFTAAQADEGMWTFDAFPAAKMQADYGWAPDQVWLDKVRQASVRLTGGCSASFVSSEGLILTNHHCVAGCAEQNSTATNNILK